MALLLVGRSGAVDIVRDNYDVPGNGSGFALASGLNSAVDPPATRLTGTAAVGLRYIHTATKASNAYTITNNKIQITAAANPGRFVLSADGMASYDFGPVLGVPSASPAQPSVYDLSITIGNDSTGVQRCSFAIGTIEGDANSWAFGFQVYRTNSGDTYYAIGKRIDTTASGLGNDLNKAITTLTPNTFGNEITMLMRVTDAGAESSGFHSRIQLSLNGGNTWFYDTATDPDLINGWRFNGPGRHVMWDIAPGAGPVTYDKFALRLNPPASTANTGAVFRVMTYNIHSASGSDNKVNTQRIADFIIDQNVDLVGLNEVARNLPRSDGRDLIAELAQETGMTFVFSNNNTSLSGNDQFGNAILSKHPVIFRDHRLLPNVGSNEQRGWLKAVVDMNGKFISFWVTHLDFHANDSERLMCVTNFNTWIADESLPVVFCGDFNETPDKTVHARMDSMWDDIWPLAGDGSLGRTSPCPGPLQTRIDFIYKAAQSSTIVPTNAMVNYQIEASDHYPELTQFILTSYASHAPGFFFPCDEGVGNKVMDRVAGLSGKLGANGPVRNPDSPTGLPGDYSLYFDGTKKITVTDTNQVIGTNGLNDDYTLQAWVKLPLNYAPPVRAVLFQYERKPGFSISINTNRTLHTTAFKIRDISSPAAIPNDGRWHHLAVVHHSGAMMQFYIDAVLAGSVAYTNGAGLRASSQITVGAASEDANWFTGNLARIAFDARALAPPELDFPAIPPLAIRRNGNNLVISWRARNVRFTLQEISDLITGSWTAVDSQLQGDEYQALVVPSQGSKYYRLQKQ